MADTYYVASRDGDDPMQGHDPDRPNVVGVSFETATILVSQGSGHGLCGSAVPIAEFDATAWETFFADAGCSWLLDVLADGTLEGPDGEAAFLAACSAERGTIETVES
ncbi:hypothetical protein [Natronobiforma cellulositropha]|uniref:hypothetical protein n=1 Tax=Natronobiforma cellulositropha TaxID=1679076 RepID=UPI0021D56A4C|nr:hypothetical protein [Natronobiforma cellulositropha]